ncbi:hypothetical protein PISL3812_04578 [Talaromyces islandicus]|uniref:Methyltransferase domain-containing protein n=1 Tax=Talaromyces islandicus TaxID=28573 RepID=A0A0U1LY53_TALIS|nr:hypothetical protein PISL3812_04578 [Talaromyces islandicus]
MGPAVPLPLSDEWDDDVDSYIDALLSFATTTPLFLNLCGGVHILDFLTSDPDLYTTLLPDDWRRFFAQHELYDILDLLLKEDVAHFPAEEDDSAVNEKEINWKNGPPPPPSLVRYIRDIRRLSLKREFTPVAPANQPSAIPRRVAVGMKSKKLHEVEHFSKYVDLFATNVSRTRNEPVTHIVDFGSGQNYLGRTLAHSYDRNIIAIERKHAFIQGARGMDVHAKMAEKEKKKVDMVNKKLNPSKSNINGQDDAPAPVCETCPPREEEDREQDEDDVTVFKVFSELDVNEDDLPTFVPSGAHKPKEEDRWRRGAMDYIEHEIKDGYLEPIIRHVVDPAKHEGDSAETKVTDKEAASDARVVVVSLHSCGNLLHHGVRSLVLNPSVVAIAMVGCCYNLMTERLGPATYKLPVLRHMHQRLAVGATEHDPHGFPMSNMFEQYAYPGGTGIKFNITARMMAVQAPYNWTEEESSNFFTRHYYRALLQKILVDRGAAPKPRLANLDALTGRDGNDSAASEPLIIGTLRKSAYQTFPMYAKAAIAKLAKNPAHQEKMTRLYDELTDQDLDKYVADYAYAKKNLSLVWTLMAFSSAVVEAMIVIDRWQFLREHMASGLVRECWIEPVFDYAESPRNLVVIGIKN